MTAQPRQFAREYSSIFGDASVVEAYRFRPSYPDETFEILLGLIDVDARRSAVLDAGCGTGAIARRLAPFVARVDAVDLSVRMIEAGRKLSGGDHPNLVWGCGAVEDVFLTPPYALIVAASSLHWMRWATVLPRFGGMLAGGGYLAVAEDVIARTPWQDAMHFIGEYSLNRDFQPYDVTTLCGSLAAQGLFEVHGTKTTAAVTCRQRVDDYVESFHSRNGLSRERMGHEAACAFDDRIRSVVIPFCVDGIVELQVSARIVWGRPTASES
jgi:SAM-dependent methyltransferase